MSDSKIERYEHHGQEVAVRSDLRGKHREFCLCYRCGLFSPMDREHNCSIANLLLGVCVACSVMTAVLECVQFIEMKK